LSTEDGDDALGRPVIALPMIEVTSPTLAETMRVCLLRAGLSQVPAARVLVLGSPKAWLGTAYHEVLAAVPRLAHGEDLDSAVKRLWEEAIVRLERRSLVHPLDRRYGPALSWPGYYVTLETVKIRAQELLHRGEGVHEPAGAEPAPERREYRFVGCGGKLVGRPDVIARAEILDYKTGEVLQGTEGNQDVRPAYARQLRLYAVLVHETLGWWPRRGVLLPMHGAAVEVELDPAACEAEAASAVALLHQYNAAVSHAVSPAALATPSLEACRWCPFKLACPAFWDAVSPAWAGKLDSEAVQGRAAGAPRPIMNGLAVALDVQVERATVGGNAVTLAPMDPDVQAGLDAVVRGTRVQVVGLYRRQDGSLAPTQRTLFAIADQAPEIRVG
jgi:hypothetical protein